MKTLRDKSRVLLFVFFLLTALFWLGMDSEVFARAGGGRSSGSSGSSSSRSYSRPATPPSQPQAPAQQVQPPAPPAGAGRGFLSGMAGGIMGGLLGGMLFSSLGFAGSGTGGGGFGFGDLLLIMVILGIIYFVVKRFRSRNTMQMSTAGAGSYSYPAPTPVPVYAPPALEAGPEDPKLEGLRHIREMDSSFSEKAFKDLSEDIFFKIQGAWTKRDLSGVRHLLSPGDVQGFSAGREPNCLRKNKSIAWKISRCGRSRSSRPARTGAKSSLRRDFTRTCSIIPPTIKALRLSPAAPRTR